MARELSKWGMDPDADAGLGQTVVEPDDDLEEIPDDRLRLIFTCCHPSLGPAADQRGLAASGDLDGYHLLHAARADLLRRSGSPGEAAESYARALDLATHASERRFLQRRLNGVRSSKNVT